MRSPRRTCPCGRSSWRLRSQRNAPARRAETMRLILHVFKKDIRRLWWEVTVATAALAFLARMDSQRADYIAGALESMFNLLVPAAWAYVIALVIHEEPLVGHTQFWITRPYPRSSLAGAKLLFVLTLVHLPGLVADAAILSARGFQPLQYVPQLLWKQLLVAVVVTLPAIALASATETLTQFISASAE